VIGVTVPTVLFLALVIPYVYVVHDTDALRLESSLDQATVVEGNDIYGTITEQNMLLVTNDLPLLGNWRASLSTDGCGSFFNTAYGLGLYEGRYTAENVSTAKSMMIYPPSGPHCPAMVCANSIRFRPLQTIGSSLSLGGYWTENTTTHTDGSVTYGTLHPFVPGTYTLAVADQWGRLILRYFKVLAR